MPNEREKIVLQLKGFDAAHYKRTEGYARQIDRLCRAASDEYAALAGSLFQPDLNKPFSFDDYPQTKKAAAQIAQGLSKQIQGVVIRGTEAEWKAACDKNDAFLKSILRTSRLTPEEAEQYQARNLEALQSFQQRKINGLGLSKRVWKYVDDIKDTIELGIDVGLGEGRSAQQMSRDLRQCLKEPDRLFRRVRDKYGNLRLSKAAKLYHPGQGVYRSSAKNAQRLTRTEVNMAYRQAEYLRWQQLDFVAGMRIMLSNNHTVLDSKGNPMPLVDMCDELWGDYPKTFKFVGWHPQCRCVVIPILSDYDEYNRERGNRLKAIVRGTAYKSMPSRRTVTAMPERFTKYIESIAERSKGWKSQPYYIRDNFKGGTIAGGLKAGVAETLKGAATGTGTKPAVKNNTKPCTEFDSTIKGLKKWAYAFGLDVSKLDALRLQGQREPLRIEVERLEALEEDRWNAWAEASDKALAHVGEMRKHGFSELETKYTQLINQCRCTEANYYADCIAKLQEIEAQAQAELAKAIAARGDEANSVVGKYDNSRADNEDEIEKAFGMHKAEAMSHNDANELRGNPNYRLGGGYRINCQSCVVAYEMRRRGYDVEANRNTGRKGNIPDELSYATEKAWLDDNGNIPKKQRAGSRYYDGNKMKNKTSGEMLSEFENLTSTPGRYHIDFDWKGGRSGHIITAERFVDGTMRVYDPQCGKVISDFRTYAEDISLASGIRILRVDNLRANPHYVSGAAKKKQ